MSIPRTTLFRKVIELLTLSEFNKFFPDTYTKKLSSERLITLMVEAQISKRESLPEIAEHLSSNAALKTLTGMSSCHYSTIYRKLAKVSHDGLRSIYSTLVSQIAALTGHCEGFLDVGRLGIIDSTEIALPKQSGKWAYCQKNKYAVKVHTRLHVADNEVHYPDKIVCSTAAVSDQEVVKHLIEQMGVTYVMDRGYINYSLFQKWHKKARQFVVRVKANSKFAFIKDHDIPHNSKIVRDADVMVSDKKSEETVKLRLVEYRDDQGKKYRVLTNRWDIDAIAVSEIYRKRWQIELFFKWMKQNINTIKLYNYEPAAVWNQIFISLITFCLVEIFRLLSGTEKTRQQLLQLIKLHCNNAYEDFESELYRRPTRTSKGRVKKGKPGRPRIHPEKLKAQKIIVL